MKRILMFSSMLYFIVLGACAQQDKSKRASPPDSVSVTTSSGVTIAINYSRPSVKGRKVGEDIAPVGKVWRTGANEATTFEISKDATINGQPLKAGKYSLHSIPGEGKSTMIFNKVWEKSGLDYDEKEDALRVEATTEEIPDSVEQFTITANEEGMIELMWGNYRTYFTVE